MNTPVNDLSVEPLTRRRNRNRDTSWVALRRQVLESIAAAARAGHRDYLKRLGVTFEVAQSLAALDPRVLADLADEQGSCAIEISVDNQALRAEVDRNIPVSHNRQLALELLAAGATRQMVKELRLVKTNAEIESLMCIAHQGEKQVGSRPATLTDKEIRICHELWRLRAEPESLHPLRHLAQTAQHLKLPVISIWMYIKEASNLRVVVHGASRGQQYPWIKCLFPKWDDAESRYGRR